jgi:hypothetical protein
VFAEREGDFCGDSDRLARHRQCPGRGEPPLDALALLLEGVPGCLGVPSFGDGLGDLRVAVLDRVADEVPKPEVEIISASEADEILGDDD